MKLRKLISLLLAAVMLLGAVAFAEPAKIVATDYTGKTIILHTNDVHGAIDGYAYIPTLRDYFYSFGWMPATSARAPSTFPPIRVP